MLVFTVEKKIPEVHPRELTPKWVSEGAEPLILTYSRKGMSVYHWGVSR